MKMLYLKQSIFLKHVNVIFTLKFIEKKVILTVIKLFKFNFF